MAEHQDPERERAWLWCEDWISGELARLGTDAWVTVYQQDKQENSKLLISSALIPIHEIERVLTEASPDVTPAFGLPCVITSCRGGEEHPKYARYGNDRGFEPLVIAREFGGIHPPQVEIAEDFRHFFRLYQNDRGVLFEIDLAGEEEEVARLGGQRVEIKLRLIKEFLAAKQMALAVYFELRRYSEEPLKLEESPERSVRDPAGHLSYDFCARPWEDHSRKSCRSSSRLYGKKLVLGSPKEAPVVVFDEFIIGTDSNGRDVRHTCDPRGLGSSGDFLFLTPVFFRREVLTKYRENPGKYEILDALVSCGTLWSVQIDNNHEKYVTVYLGDLGRMPARERSYWKSFNVPPEGGTSEVNFRRSMLGRFTSPAMKDLLFKERLGRFQNDWQRRFGWDLFKPLTDSDVHYLAAMCIPLANAQKQFDDQVLALAKVLVDSINDRELDKRIPPQQDGARSIRKLEAFLASKEVDGSTHIKFLHDLFKLRHGSSHRKGKDYDKAKTTFRVEELGFIDAFTAILEQAIAMLDFLRERFLVPPEEAGAGVTGGPSTRSPG